MGGALGTAELHQQVGTVLLTDEVRHLELLLETAASGVASCVCSLENRQPLRYGTSICTATELVTGHWHAAADSHACQDRQPKKTVSISLCFANLVCHLVHIQ